MVVFIGTCGPRQLQMNEETCGIRGAYFAAGPM